MPIRKTSKKLPATVYVYLTLKNAAFAKTQGKKTYGSASAYINALISKERNVKPVLGGWKARKARTKK